MKLDYNKLLEINKDSCVDNYGTLNCFWVIQDSVEKFMRGDELTPQQTQLLIELEVLKLEEEDRRVVKSFNFTEDGSKNTN